MSDLTKPQVRKHKIDLARLFKNNKHYMCVHEDIAITIIIQSRLSDQKTIKLRADLGFNQINLILKKEQSVLIPLLKAFSAEKNKTAEQSLKKRKSKNLYVSEHKFAIEIDEKGHTDRNHDDENERQTKIEKHSDCKFFHRINPDAEGFNIFVEISKIQNCIIQSTEENKIKEQKDKTKKLENKIKEQKSKFVKELLSYLSSISMTLKHIKHFLKKILPTLLI